MALSIEPYQEQYLGALATLLAECERDRADHPLQRPFLLVDEDAARRALESTVRQRRSDGVIALEGGRPEGFLLAVRELPAPLSDEALVFAPRSIVIDENSSARPDRAYDTIRALYAALAARWAGGGFLDHYVNAPRAATEHLRAWRSLGFGMNMVRGIRDTGPVAQRGDARVEIHEATVEDHAIIAELAIANFRYHAAPPMFMPSLVETEAATRARERDLLEEPGAARFIASRDERVAGIATFRPWDGDRPGLLRPTVHLQHGFTVDEARGGGVGSALLDHGMAWAREQGYERCTVNWVAANPLGARFWQRQGFVPIAYRLYRRIDPRILFG